MAPVVRKAVWRSHISRQFFLAALSAFWAWYL
jgi:hypothetical protein